MNKNTTILLGALTVLAIGAGAYVSMSKPSQEGFSTQSVRGGTRSLAGGTTFQSKSTTTTKTTDTYGQAPTSDGGDGDALPKSQCEFIGCPGSEKFLNGEDVGTAWSNGVLVTNGSSIDSEFNFNYGIMGSAERIEAQLNPNSNVLVCQYRDDNNGFCPSPNFSLGAARLNLQNKSCKAINEPGRIGVECCPEGTEQAPNTPTAIGDSM